MRCGGGAGSVQDDPISAVGLTWLAERRALQAQALHVAKLDPRYPPYAAYESSRIELARLHAVYSKAADALATALIAERGDPSATLPRETLEEYRARIAARLDAHFAEFAPVVKAINDGEVAYRAVLAGKVR